MLLTLLTVFFMHCDAMAQKSAGKTQIFEQEATQEKTTSFTAKVRVVRDIADDVEVFFDSDKARGAYTLPRNAANYAAMFEALEKSKSPKGLPVSVTADEDKRIKSVSTPAGKAEPDPNKPWEF